MKANPPHGSSSLRSGQSKRIYALLVPAGILALGLAYLTPNFFKSYNAGDRGFNFDAFAALPVQDGGRFKPMDTVARMHLMIISGRQTFTDTDGTTQPAIKWLLDVMTCYDAKSKSFNGPAMEQKIFRVENDQVLSLVGLKERSRFRYSIEEFREKIGDVMEHAERARVIDAKKRDLFDTKVLELADHLALFQQLALKRTPRVVIPPHGDKEEWYALDGFLPPRTTVEEMKAVPTAAIHYLLLEAYASNDKALFNQILAESQRHITKDLPSGAASVNMELFYNRFAAFHYASEFYIYALVLGLLSWLGWTKPLHRAAILLMIVALGLHTYGLLARMIIQDRPLVVVTNLYSSAIFIGWGCALFCLATEFIFPRGIALVAGSSIAAITGIIAHHLSLSGDTMEMMQAVLDTNFWLATHVTCVTLGYTATFFAGFLGILYVILGVFTPMLRHDGATMLAKMLYGVICFATLLSFTGTVLGGIWADQSWGRFWGWDPKENGALLIVIWNALILHARWGGMIKQRGMAQLAIAGNVVTSWSWFGTNMLGVGLHSYGFMPAALAWLLFFAATQLILIAIGWIPLENWLSFRRLDTPPTGQIPPGGDGDLPPRLPGPRPAISSAS